MREQAGWHEHARYMDELFESGFVLFAGPLEGEREVLWIVEADSQSAIRERMAEDPWQVNGMLREPDTAISARMTAIRATNAMWAAAIGTVKMLAYTGKQMSSKNGHVRASITVFATRLPASQGASAQT